MDIKDIQIGKTYRFAGGTERGTVVVTSVTNDIGPWPVEGDALIERTNTDNFPVEVLLYADEIIEEVV